MNCVRLDIASRKIPVAIGRILAGTAPEPHAIQRIAERKPLSLKYSRTKGVVATDLPRARKRCSTAGANPVACLQVGKPPNWLRHHFTGIRKH
jgi:hypothetical protein